MTKIEWAGETWNPIRGCTEVSPGCAKCYARRTAGRLATMGPEKGYVPFVRPRKRGEPARWSGRVQLHPGALLTPIRWRAPRRIFPCSMSDIGHEDMDLRYWVAVWAVICGASWHTFQVLTKRPDSLSDRVWHIVRAAAEAHSSPYEWLAGELEDRVDELIVGAVLPIAARDLLKRLRWPTVWPPPHVWIGVSGERMTEARPRLESVLRIPAALHWISAEPLLGRLNLRRWLYAEGAPGKCMDELGNWNHEPGGCDSCRPGLGWVVVGGETGPQARPAPPDWFRDLRGQCDRAEVPFFFKQAGAWSVATSTQAQRPQLARVWVSPDDVVAERSPEAMGLDPRGWTELVRCGKKAAGRELDGALCEEFPS